MKLSIIFPIHLGTLDQVGWLKGTPRIIIKNLKQKKKKSKAGGTRRQRNRWTCSASLSTDTSGIQLQTQKWMQNTS